MKAIDVARGVDAALTGEEGMALRAQKVPGPFSVCAVLKSTPGCSGG